MHQSHGNSLHFSSNLSMAIFAQNISQGSVKCSSVATCLKMDGVLGYQYTNNSPVSLKEFWISVNISLNRRKMYTAYAYYFY